MMGPAGQHTKIAAETLEIAAAKDGVQHCLDGVYASAYGALG
jgi:hypothetical protein